MKQEIEQAVDQMVEEDEPSPEQMDLGTRGPSALTDEEKRFWFDWDEGGIEKAVDNADTSKFDNRELAADVDAIKAAMPRMWRWYKETDDNADMDEPYPPREEE